MKGAAVTRQTHNQTLAASFIRSLLWLSLASVAVFASNAMAEGVLDSVQQTMKAASSGWMEKGLEYAKTLFFGLAALEFVWSAIQLTVKKNELSDLAVSVMLKVLSIAFFAMMLLKAPEWIPAIVNSFVSAGTGISGTTEMTPSGVFSQGVGLASDLVTKGMQVNAQNTSLGNVVSSGGASLGEWLLSAIIIGGSGIMVIIAFVVIAVQLFVALVESFLVIGGGALMLGFLGSRWTMSFGEKFFGYAVSVGVKLFALYLIVGFGGTFIAEMGRALDALVAAGKPVGLGDYLGMGGASLVFGGVGYMAPGLASTMLSGSPSLSMSNLGAASGTLAGAPVAAGMAGGAALLQGGGYAASLMQTSKAAGAIGGSAAPPSGNAGSVAGLSRLTGADGGGNNPSPGSNLSGSSQGASSAASAPGKLSLGSAGPQGSQMGQGKDSSKATSNGFAGPQAHGSQEAGGQGKDPSRSMDQDRRAFDAAHNSENASSFSKRLFDKAREMQFQADRRKPHLVHDGQSGAGVQIRMGLGE